MERPLTQHITPGQSPLSLKEYEAKGGYVAVRTAITNLTPESVQQAVKDSGLKGRGGAGFNTGTKWSFVPMGTDAPRTKYLIAGLELPAPLPRGERCYNPFRSPKCQSLLDLR